MGFDTVDFVLVTALGASLYYALSKWNKYNEDVRHEREIFNFLIIDGFIREQSRLRFIVSNYPHH